MTLNALYAQSGGVTPVINATARGVRDAVAQHPDRIGRLLAGCDGLLGVLEERLIDASALDEAMWDRIAQSPGGAFGSCRLKLKHPEEQEALFARVLAVFQAHNIGYFFYNGGGDSQDTAHKIATYCNQKGHPVICMGIPKTIDNDLKGTDCCPGFGSVAKYIATATMEASLDVASMCATSTKVFVLEVMGRHTGWLAASAGLAQQREGDPPHVILFPERVFEPDTFLKAVDTAVQNHGYCTVVASEGIKNQEGQFLSDRGLRDAFGHAQLGGVAPYLAELIKERLGYKNHWAVADYLQRSARHVASQTDVTQAYALGESAVTLALDGQHGCMPVIVRTQDWPYRWHIEHVPLAHVANHERMLPESFISKEGFGITPACVRYLKPLIQGEAVPTYHEGLPCYARAHAPCLPKQLPEFSVPK